MTDQNQRNAVLFRIADQFEGAAADLADRPGGTFDRVRMHCLDRIDHQQARRIHRAQRGKDVAHARCRSELHRCIGQAKPGRAHTHLPRGLFAADIDHSAPFARDFRGSLQQQSRLADTRIAAQKDRRAGDQPAAQRAIEFCKPRGLACRQRAGLVEIDELNRAPPARQIVFHREDRGRRVLDQRVPFRTIGTLALPAVRDSAAGLADIAFLGFRHAPSLNGTFHERNCHWRFMPS